VRTSLNLSGIFRAIGIRDNRQAVDTVDLLQPTVIMGDYSRLGPSVLPPISIFGGLRATFAGDHAYNVLEAPPEGCIATWSAFVANQGGNARQANEIFQFRLAEVPVSLTGINIWVNHRSGHQPSRAVLSDGTGPLPPSPTYWPTGHSGGGVVYRHQVPGGWFLEVWTKAIDLTMVTEWTVEDVVVQPLPDASLAATP